MNRVKMVRLAFAVVAISFFAAPIAARVAGVTADRFENRRLAHMPKLSQGWDAFPQATRFLVDRMPLREQAVEVNTRIWTDVFGTAPRYGSRDGGRPVDQVLVGRDEWLFLREELEQACAPTIPHARAAARWVRLIRSVRESGRAAILVVAPDKGSIYPELLEGDRLVDCAGDGKRDLWRLLDSLPRGAGIVSLYDALRERRGRWGDDLYARKDSHWTPIGSLSMVTASLGRLGDGISVEQQEIGKPTRVRYTGDLTVLRGLPERDTYASVPIVRARRAPRVDGRLAVVGDSYSITPGEQLRQYFEAVRTVAWEKASLREVADVVAGADMVVFEVVEREFAKLAVRDGPVMELLAKLEHRRRDVP